MNIRAHERARMLFLGLLVVAIWSGLAIAMTVSDALLLSQLGVPWVPVAMLLSAVSTLLGSLALNRRLQSQSLGSLLQATLTLGISLVSLALGLLLAGAGWVGLPLAGIYAAFFTLLSTQVFALAAECMDPHSSKRLFPVLAVAATLGELLGGLLVALAGGNPRWGLALWLLSWLLAAAWLARHQARLKSWRGARPPTLSLPWNSLASYARRQPMARALGLLLFSMVLCQGVSQLVISQVLTRELHSPEQLARFLGWLVAASNLAELFIAGWLTPLLLTHLGVRLTSTLQPLCMALALLALEVERSLTTAVLLWLSRRMLQDSLGAPARNLLYNALPGRLRPSLRSFLDGCVVAAAQLGIGLLLRLLLPHWTLAHFCHLGVVLGLLYWAAAWGAAGAYLRGLLGDLQQVGLRLQESAAPAQATEEPPQGAQELASDLAHGDPSRRARAVAGLVRQQSLEAALPYLQSESTVTVEAALAVVGGCSSRGWARSWLLHQLEMRTRRAALAWLAARAWPRPPQRLEEQFLALSLEKSSSQDQHLALAVLGWLEGPELVELLQRSLRGDSGRRGAALEVLSQLGHQQVLQTLVCLLEPAEAEERARRLELQVGAGLEDPLAWALYHPDPWVRWAALRVERGSRPAQRHRQQELLSLGACPLLRDLPLEALEWLREKALPLSVGAGTRLQLRGRPVVRACLRVEGRLSPDLEMFGWVESLDGGEALQDVEAQETTRLLALRPALLRQLVQRYPGCAGSWFSWLCQQLRQRERRS